MFHNPLLMPGRRENPNIWTPEGMQGLVNWLPLGEGAASADQLIPDLVTTAGATYRGATVAVEATDPTWTAEGLSFDGGDYCNMDASAPLYTDGAEMAVALLFKAPSAAAYRTIYSEGSPTGNDGYLYLNLTNADKLSVQIRDDADVAATATSLVDFADNTWHTVVLNVDTSPSMSLHADGVGAPVATVSLAALGATTPSLASVGALRNYEGEPIQLLSGNVGYVMRFDRVLTQPEIAQVHNYIRGRVAGRGITLPAA